MGASGADHAPGTVPDPGATAGAGKFLREDATFANSLNAGLTVTGGTTTDSLTFLNEDQGISFPNSSQIFEDATLGLILLGSPVCTFVATSGTTLTLENSDGVNSGNIVQISGVTSPLKPTILEIYSGSSTSYLINTTVGLLDPSNTYELQLGVGANSGTAPPTFSPIFSVGDTLTRVKGFTKFDKIGGNNALSPTIAVGVAAGVGASASLTVASDVSGIISLTTGTGPSANAQLLKLTFSSAFPTTPKILLFPASAAASALPIWASAASDSEQDINTGATAPTASVSTYSWFYIVTA